MSSFLKYRGFAGRSLARRMLAAAALAAAAPLHAGGTAPAVICAPQSAQAVLVCDALLTLVEEETGAAPEFLGPDDPLPEDRPLLRLEMRTAQPHHLSGRLHWRPAGGAWEMGQFLDFHVSDAAVNALMATKFSAKLMAALPGPFASR